MIFKTDKNTDAEAERDRRNAYRNVLSTNEGKMVLVDILGTLGFWDTVIPPRVSETEHNILNLHAKKILDKCGFWKPENIVGNMLKGKKDGNSSG